MTKDLKRGVALNKRMIPFPASISWEARSALERLVGDDGVPYNALHSMPTVQDHDAWLRLKVEAEANYAEAIKRFAGHLRSTVDTTEASEATIHVATPETLVREDCAYLDIHGGALVLGGGEACRTGARLQADQHGVRVFSVDYRMPPKFAYPAGLDDCLAAYRKLLAHYSPNAIVIGGRSAGGNLAAATLLRAKVEGLPLPAGLVLLSPQVDLTESGDSFECNQMLDVVLPSSLMNNNQLYANGGDLSHPYLSPLFGDLTGFPPTFLQSGTRDLFLSNAVRMHRALRRVGTQAELHVFEAMPHGGFQGGTPEDAELEKEVSRFVHERWP